MTANTLNLLGNLLITQEAAQQGGAMGMLNMFLPFILIFGIFYFLVILPQRKQMKKHNEMLNQLKKGDTVKLAIDTANRTKYSYFPVVNNKNKCLGTVKLAEQRFPGSYRRGQGCRTQSRDLSEPESRCNCSENRSSKRCCKGN